MVKTCSIHKRSFGYKYPNYDPKALANIICHKQSWELIEVRFYTGVPDAQDDAFWNHFWTAKLAQMADRKSILSQVVALSEPIGEFADGTQTTILVGQEKGVDIRIALDVVRLALRRAYDVALVFSQDQDLSEQRKRFGSLGRNKNGG